jgi:hypothetical protein
MFDTCEDSVVSARSRVLVDAISHGDLRHIRGRNGRDFSRRHIRRAGFPVRSAGPGVPGILSELRRRGHWSPEPPDGVVFLPLPREVVVPFGVVVFGPADHDAVAEQSAVPCDHERTAPPFIDFDLFEDIDSLRILPCSSHNLTPR